MPSAHPAYDPKQTPGRVIVGVAEGLTPVFSAGGDAPSSLSSTSILGGMLWQTGDSLIFEYSGQMGVTAGTTNQFDLQIAGYSLAGLDLFKATFGGGWVFKGRLFRLDSGGVYGFGAFTSLDYNVVAFLNHTGSIFDDTVALELFVQTHVVNEVNLATVAIDFRGNRL